MAETNAESCCSPNSVKGVRIYIKSDVCNGCGTCGEVCPFGLPQVDGSGKFEIKQAELCIECSACKRNCPTEAIIMQEQVGCGCLWDAKQRLKNPDGPSNCC